MNKLNNAKRTQVITALVEGNSVNSTVRMTGISKPTILKLVKDFGDVCQKFHDQYVFGLKTKRVQCDELWAFCHCKQGNIRPELQKAVGIGDVWTWSAIDADAKLMISWHVGERDTHAAHKFLQDVANRIDNRVQVTSDGFQSYVNSVCNAFNDEVDYAQLIKVYGTGFNEGHARYSPPDCVATKKKTIIGNPDAKHVSTSYVERSNLTARMGMRRYTRLTNGFSKKFENHVAMTAIFYTYYNWCRIHQTLRVTPAMASGLTTKLWEIDDLVALMG
jgi:transposase-like protein